MRIFPDDAALEALCRRYGIRRLSLFGSAATVQEGVEAWQEAGVSTPVIVPSSASGGQLKALEEIFATFG